LGLEARHDTFLLIIFSCLARRTMCSPSSFANKANIMLSTSLVFSDSRVTENSGYEFFNPKNSSTTLFRQKKHIQNNLETHINPFIYSNNLKNWSKKINHPKPKNFQEQIYLGRQFKVERIPKLNSHYRMELVNTKINPFSDQNDINR